MLGIGEWITRLKQNRGFGVQSPSDFYFVTQVLKERLPYYAYEEIDRIAAECRRHSARHCRMLFRITNYFAPRSIIVAGAGRGETACAIAAACPNATTIVAGTQNLAPCAKEILHRLPQAQCTGEGEALHAIRESRQPLLVYVGDTTESKQIIEAATEHAKDGTVIIIDGIHRTPQDLEQWNKAAACPKATITYDLYSAGIMLFDSKRYKQHYMLKK